VASISGSVVNTTFSYDANGNQTAGDGLTLTYASFQQAGDYCQRLGADILRS
jgi:hypothetical protein